jgi:hypothetical protein
MTDFVGHRQNHANYFSLWFGTRLAPFSQIVSKRKAVTVSRILKTALISLAGLAVSTAASAGCSDGTYCTSNTSTLAPLGSWTASAGESYTMGSNYSSGSTRYVSTQSYPTGSISNSYTDSSVQTYGFHGSTTGLSGLGTNESLQATNCPTNVYNPEGGKVLGCYNVVKPVAQTSYYRIVRPIVYVRYPVPVAVPYYSGCTVVTHVSRYGDFGHNRYGQGHYGRRCG